LWEFRELPEKSKVAEWGFKERDDPCLFYKVNDRVDVIPFFLSVFNLN